MSLFKDTKMGCTVLRNGRKKAVFGVSCGAEAYSQEGISRGAGWNQLVGGSSAVGDQKLFCT